MAGEGRRQPIGEVAAVPLTWQAALEHRLGEFLDEERHAVRASGDLVHHPFEERFAARDVLNHRGTLPAREPLERVRRDVRQADPGRLELGPEGDDEQHGQARHPLDDAIQQLQRGRVDPVDIFKDHQDWLLPSEEFELA